MKLIRIGKVGRSHGFRGAFIAQDHSGEESALGSANQLWVGSDAASAVPLEVIACEWMSQGWRVHLKETDEKWVKDHLHQSLFLPRTHLPPPPPGQFYVEDLVGLTVWNEPDGTKVGTLVAVETVADGLSPDRWWVESTSDRFAIPAADRYIARISLEENGVWVRHLEELP